MTTSSAVDAATEDGGVLPPYMGPFDASVDGGPTLEYMAPFDGGLGSDAEVDEDAFIPLYMSPPPID